MKVSFRLSLVDFVGESRPSALGCPFLYRTKAFGKLLLAAVGSESLRQIDFSIDESQKPEANGRFHWRELKASGKWVFPLMRAKSLRQNVVSTVDTQKPEANGRFHW